MGKAWEGDWRARLARALGSRGYESLTDYAQTEPTDPLTKLAETLDCDVAAIQLETVLEEEAGPKGQLRRLRARHVRSIPVEPYAGGVEPWRQG